MKVLLFVDDYYSEKGVCYDVYFSNKILVKYTDIDVHILHWAEKNEKKVFTIHGLNIFQQIMKVREIVNTNSIDIVHIRGIGLMSKYHFIFYWGSILSNSKLIMSTFSQATSYSLDNKLFFEDPHVKNLVNGRVKSVKIKNKILSFISPILKKIYFRTFGNFFIKRSNAIVFFSEFEKKEVLKHCSFTKIVEVIEEPILNIENLEKKLLANNTDNFYKKCGLGDSINIVYWGRLDYNTKGIDRIIRSVQSSIFNKKFKVHLMGPDYNNDKEKIKNILDTMNLSDTVIVHESTVWKGTMKPLMDADFSILASKFDGFPRALRESLALNVPIICSIETNFKDIINDFNCGYIFENDKELSEIFNNISLDNISKLKENCLKATKYLSEESIGTKLKTLYERVNNE